MYAVKISRGMVRMFSTKSDMWLILFLKTSWEYRGVHIEITMLSRNRNLRVVVLDSPAEEDYSSWVFLA